MNAKAEIHNDEYAEFESPVVVPSKGAASMTRNVHQRLAAAMAQVSYIQKDEKKPGMQYRVVTHDKVTALVRPALLEQGVVYYPHELTHTQNGNRTEVALTVRFVNIDNPADFFDVPSLGYGLDTQDKGPGKAISYSVKYALLKAMGLETGDDPDLDQKTEHVKEEPAMTGPDGTPIPTLEEVLIECAEQFEIIRDGIDSGNYQRAADTWFVDVTGGQKMAAFVAPTKHKNAPFTTKQRDVLKSREFRLAASYHQGEDNG